MKQFLWEKTHS